MIERLWRAKPERASRFDCDFDAEDVRYYIDAHWSLRKGAHCRKAILGPSGILEPSRDEDRCGEGWCQGNEETTPHTSPSPSRAS